MAIFSGDIPLHRPYIGLTYGRYLHFRILKWPLTYLLTMAYLFSPRPSIQRRPGMDQVGTNENSKGHLLIHQMLRMCVCAKTTVECWNVDPREIERTRFSRAAKWDSEVRFCFFHTKVPRETDPVLKARDAEGLGRTLLKVLSRCQWKAVTSA